MKLLREIDGSIGMFAKGLRVREAAVWSDTRKIWDHVVHGARIVVRIPGNHNNNNDYYYLSLYYSFYKCYFILITTLFILFFKLPLKCLS
jgi:hypothetical protein